MLSLALFVAPIALSVLSLWTFMQWGDNSRHVSPQRGWLWIHWQTPYQHLPLPAPPSRFLVNWRVAKVHYVVTDDYVTEPTEVVRSIHTDLNIPLWEISLVGAF